jgi:hypothetical protein
VSILLSQRDRARAFEEERDAEAKAGAAYVPEVRGRQPVEVWVKEWEKDARYMAGMYFRLGEQGARERVEEMMKAYRDGELVVETEVARLQRRVEEFYGKADQEVWEENKEEGEIVARKLGGYLEREYRRQARRTQALARRRKWRRDACQGVWRAEPTRCDAPELCHCEKCQKEILHMEPNVRRCSCDNCSLLLSMVERKNLVCLERYARGVERSRPYVPAPESSE